MDYRKMAEDNQILKVRVGSHLFGTDTPESDLDYEGIFMPSKSMLFGLASCREVDLGKASKDESGRNTSDAVDYKIREYRTFVRLALQNNPNILNILFTNRENVIFSDDFGRRLLGRAMLFPHKEGLKRFMGYAISQLKKMSIKPDNYSAFKSAEERLSAYHSSEILVYVAKMEPDIFKDGGVGKHIQVGDIFFERGLKVSRALSMVKGRLERASSRSKMWEDHGFDCKFASNLIQILEEGIELADTGMIQFPLRCRKIILAIKRGEYTKEAVEDMASGLESDLRTWMGKTELPSKPRFEEVETFVIKEVERWAAREL